MTSETRDVVVPDTSCLIALQALGRLDLLRHIYGQTVVPPQVAREHVQPLPDWFRIQEPLQAELVAALRATLGPGEAAAIALASANAGWLLILDDLRARRTAASMGLNITGTVGVLLRARREGHLPSLAHALDVAKGTGSRMTPELQAEALRLAGEEGG